VHDGGAACHAVLVGGRGDPRTIDLLGLACTHDEKPRFTGGVEHTSAWLGFAQFTGCAVPVDAGGNPAAPEVDVRLDGSFYAVVAPGRLGLIISPEPADQPAVWISIPLARIAASAHGSEGLFKKRPSTLQLRAGEAHLTLAQVSRVFERSNRFQAGQAAELLDVLGGR
jgi:hypothetical protein